MRVEGALIVWTLIWCDRLNICHVSSNACNGSAFRFLFDINVHFAEPKQGMWSLPYEWRPSYCSVWRHRQQPLQRLVSFSIVNRRPCPYVPVLSCKQFRLHCQLNPEWNCISWVHFQEQMIGLSVRGRGGVVFVFEAVPYWRSLFGSAFLLCPQTL